MNYEFDHKQEFIALRRMSSLFLLTFDIQKTYDWYSWKIATIHYGKHLCRSNFLWLKCNYFAKKHILKLAYAFLCDNLRSKTVLKKEPQGSNYADTIDMIVISLTLHFIGH